MDRCGLAHPTKVDAMWPLGRCAADRPTATLGTMSTATTTTNVSSPSRRAIRPLAILGTIACTLAVWVAARSLAGVDLGVRLGPGTAVTQVGPVAVAATSLLAGLAAWGLLAVLERTTRRPGRVWTVIAVAVLIVSLTGPLGAAVTPAGRAALAAMHLVAGLVLVPSLARTARPARN
jgi:hypothetical protein